MHLNPESIKFRSFEVIGRGFSGFTFKVETDRGLRACSVIPELQTRENNEIDLAFALADKLGTSIDELIDFSFIMPIEVIDATQQIDDQISDGVQNHSGYSREKAFELIRSMERAFDVNPLAHQEGFTRLIIGNKTAMEIYIGSTKGVDDSIDVVKEYAKQEFPHKLHLYPFIEKEPQSIRDILVKFSENTSLIDALFSPEYVESIVKWLAEKVTLINSVGYVNGDISLGNILSSESGWLLADHKECKKLDRKNLIAEKKNFAWVVSMLLAPSEMIEEVRQSILIAEPFSKGGAPRSKEDSLIQKFMPIWIEQFIHGVELSIIIPEGKPIEGSSQLARRVLKQSGLSEDIIKMLERFPYTNDTYEEFVRSLFDKINHSQITSGRKTKRRRR